jgi:hypothetical protein
LLPDSRFSDALRILDIAPQQIVGKSENQHTVRLFEDDFVRPAVVTDRDVSGAKPRFALILSIDAFAFQLQVQEMHLASRSCNLFARVPHDLRIRIDLGHAYTTLAGSRQVAGEVHHAGGAGLGHLERIGADIVPVRGFASRQ